MKKIYLLLAMLILGKISFAQVIFSEDFQSGTMPAGFTLINDANTVNSAIASLFPNAWDVRTEYDDTLNYTAQSTSWFESVAAADRWMITPAIVPAANSVLTWRGKAQDADYPDGYAVKLSTTGIAKTDFTVNAFSIAAEGSAWTNHSFNLGTYAGQTIHIDDIKVASPSSVNEEYTNGIELSQNQPNPATNATLIRYKIQNNADVSLEIYDITGRLVVSYNEGNQIAGKHNIYVDSDKLNKGTYFYTLKADNQRLTKKMIITQ